ncbi:hypothetical protein B0H16DRAFT_1472524 [Mycena metata]|uniref:Uncharacterized protein n=1 Tax=Mycena metata TaxID=1033252 RepID=A0AAD7HNI2_9AGAR|nr:hypothetical protein B0H16DRAFT_1472524 [Mycena metata]
MRMRVDAWIRQLPRDNDYDYEKDATCSRVLPEAQQRFERRKEDQNVVSYKEHSSAADSQRLLDVGGAGWGWAVLKDEYRYVLGAPPNRMRNGLGLVEELNAGLSIEVQQAGNLRNTGGEEGSAEAGTRCGREGLYGSSTKDPNERRVLGVLARGLLMPANTVRPKEIYVGGDMKRGRGMRRPD